MRFLCRWHIAWSGVPSSRPIVVAIAIVVVGGTLLETGGVARTLISSSDAPVPIAARTGSGDVLVAVVTTSLDRTLTRAGGGASRLAALRATVVGEPARTVAGPPGAFGLDPAERVADRAGAAARESVSEPFGAVPEQPLLTDPDSPTQYQALAAQALASTSVAAGVTRSATRAARGPARSSAKAATKAQARRRSHRRRGPWKLSRS